MTSPLCPAIRRRILWSLAGLWLLAALFASISTGYAAPPRLDDASPIDNASREVNPRGPVKCPDVGLVTYLGDKVGYHKPLHVNPDFEHRLKAFEAVLAETAIRYYGRAPTTVRHLGSFKCRRIARYPHLVSEHGLGNALDVAGFAFKPLPRGKKLPDGAPKSLTKAFTATVLDDWTAPTRTKSNAAKVKAYHSGFLHALAAELDSRPDIFRVMLGPGYPGHRDHFHFDYAPYRLTAW